MLFLCIH